MKMLIILWIGFCVSLSLAQECKISGSKCTFSGVILGRNDILPYKSSYKLTKITQVNFENSNVHAVPKEIFNFFPHLGRLDMIGQNIKEIRDDTFANARNLKILQLQNNAIETLSNNTFKGAEKLEELWLIGNSLKKIEPRTFDHVKKLKIFRLDANQITEIATGAFDSLIDLVVIGLNGNKIKFLDAEIFKNNQKLEKVWLHKNFLKRVGRGQFDQLSNLKILQLWDNQIAEIPVGLFDSLINLEEIGLAGNKIEFLDADVFKNNLNLITIWLYENSLEFLHQKTFSKLVNLNLLTLRGSTCINKDWASEAYQNLKSIEESLQSCNDNYEKVRPYKNYEEITRIGSNLTRQNDLLAVIQKEIENLKLKLDKIEEKLNTKIVDTEAKIGEKFDKNLQRMEETFSEKLTKIQEDFERNLQENLKAMEVKFEENLENVTKNLNQKFEENMRNLEGKFNRNINDQISDTETKFNKKFEEINKISQVMELDLNAKIEISNENLTKNVILPLQKSFNDEVAALKQIISSKFTERVNLIDEELKSNKQMINIVLQNNHLQLDQIKELERNQVTQSEKISEIDNELQTINEIEASKIFALNYSLSKKSS